MGGDWLCRGEEKEMFWGDEGGRFRGDEGGRLWGDDGGRFDLGEARY